MLEIHGLDAEGQLPITDVPALRERALVPAAAAGICEGDFLPVSGRRAS